MVITNQSDIDKWESGRQSCSISIRFAFIVQALKYSAAQLQHFSASENYSQHLSIIETWGGADKLTGQRQSFYFIQTAIFFKK